MSYLNPIDNTVPADTLSERYTLINTRRLVTIAENQGFSVASIKYPKSRSGSNTATRVHQLRLDLPEHREAYSQREERPQLIIQNSHDGTAALKIMVGVFRLVCLNGLIAGSAHLNIRLRHVGLVQEDVEHSLEIAAKSTVNLMTQVDVFKNKQLSQAEQEQFARQAITIRANAAALKDYETKNLLNNSANVTKVLSARRREDMGTSLWEVFNKVQENIVNPRLYLSYENAEKEIRRLGRLTAIRQNTKVNQSLWELAENYAA